MARGPDGDLTIDVAWFGPERPRRALLHSSGLHGVEGFAGSAIQLRIMADLPQFASDTALILVHVLNPYGMAWLRRVNENNVDLNRNFLPEGERYDGQPDRYDALDSFLNPTRLPAIDLFVLKAGWLILRYGRPAVKDAVVSGQYDYPAGLFFGGKELQEGARLYRDFLIRRMGAVERLFAVDVHTGLGRFGEDTVLVDPSAYARLRPVLGERVQAFDASGGNVAYRIRGGLHEIIPQVNSTANIEFVGQEFGTYGGVRVLNALRKENWAHHHGGPKDRDTSKRDLREAFCPDATRWREKVLRRGTMLFAEALSVLDEER